ncbi:hypothetical protein V8C26DRAFT_393420 [Trichoderma gracile]
MSRETGVCVCVCVGVCGWAFWRNGNYNDTPFLSWFLLSFGFGYIFFLLMSCCCDLLSLLSP